MSAATYFAIFLIVAIISWIAWELKNPHKLDDNDEMF